MATAARRASSSASAGPPRRTRGRSPRTPARARPAPCRGRQRHADVRAQAELANQPQVLVVVRVGGQQRLGDVRHQLRLPRADDVGQAVRRVRAGGPAVLDLLHQPDLFGIRVLHGQPPQLAVFREHVHGAPVRQHGHGQVGHGRAASFRSPATRPARGWPRPRSRALPARGARSVTSVVAPTHSRTRPSSSRTGTLRTPTRRHAPSARRRRSSVSKMRSAAQRRRHSAAHALPVVRVHGPHPSPAAPVALRRQSRERAQVRLRLAELAVRGGRPHHLRRRGDQRAEARLAAAHGLRLGVADAHPPVPQHAQQDDAQHHQRPHQHAAFHPHGPRRRERGEDHDQEGKGHQGEVVAALHDFAGAGTTDGEPWADVARRVPSGVCEIRAMRACARGPPEPGPGNAFG